MSFLSILLTLLLLSSRAFSSTVLVLDLNGAVDPGSADYLIEGIRRAEAESAAAVVICVDTPGGLVESAREIVQAELGARVPIIVWVGPSGARAGSAGVFITLAAHVGAMAPGTNIGAAHPVSLFGTSPGGGSEGGGGAAKSEEERANEAENRQAMEEKIVNDTAAWARAIAELRGRNVAWAEASVTESVSITDQEALAEGIIDRISPDLRSLLDAVDGQTVTLADGPATLATRGAELVQVEMSLRQKIAHFLGNPNILFVLVALGALGIYAEFHNPGMVVPGVVGGISLLSAAIGLSMIPFNLGGLLLVFFGFVLFALEIWIPSYGALTIGGIVSLVLGGLLMFDVENMDLRIDMGVLAAVPIVAAAFAMLAGWLVLRSHREKVQTGSEALIDAQGEVTLGGESKGWVRVTGEIWRARWEGHLHAGDPVRVRAVEHLTLLVEPARGNGPNTSR